MARGGSRFRRISRACSNKEAVLRLDEILGALQASLGVTVSAGVLLATASGALAAEKQARGADNAVAAPAASCESLARNALPNIKIKLAAPVAAGQFSPAQGAPVFIAPAFCRIVATLSPSADSEIGMELWLPQLWNGKFLAIGIGGWGGAINYAGMAPGLQRGYATVATDTGHRGGPGDASFAYGHPEKVTDFAWRAVHEMAVHAKALTVDYYGRSPRFSYWNGCSAGGRQGLVEVQRFPADFDGVIAGAPAVDWLGLNAGSLWTSLINVPRGGVPNIGLRQSALLHQAVIAQCDAIDGLRDGEIADPRRCDFRAKSLVCKPGRSDAGCLTPDQAAAADKLYKAVRNSFTGKLVLPGLLPGSENGWGAISAPTPPAVDEFKYVVLGDPAWDPYTFDLPRDLAKAQASDIIAALAPDLSAFKGRGGKLLQYHGWADPVIPTEMSLNYYESVAARMGGLVDTQDFYRLFLVPGMAHCGGAYAVDWLSALEDWVEKGRAPVSIEGRRTNTDAMPGRAQLASSSGPPLPLDRKPICAYPNLALYTGFGPTTDPSSFNCRAAVRGSRHDHGRKYPES
jgi:feruloyl esterase